jgi:adenylate kinase family enzyme
MAVHAQLAGWCHPGGDLHAMSVRSTADHYPLNDVARARFKNDLVSEYLDRHDGPSEEATAIITAGVPGAGKTTMLEKVVEDLANFRRLDADVFKVELIEKAVADGIYADILDRKLEDGHGVAPMELAPLVHRESNDLLLNMTLTECLDRQENIVIEGTLTWDEQPRVLYDQLAKAGYSHVIVLGIEVEQEVAHRQALSRWWTDRQAWHAGAHALGGRFTPPYSIEDGFAGGALSVCTRHALGFLDLAQSGDIATVEVKIYSPTSSGGYDLVEDGSVRRC